MKSSIYISMEEIQIIGHNNGVVEHFSSVPLPEGTMYNGNIIEPSVLIECLIALKKDNPGIFKPGVDLVVDGGTILSRRIVTPRLNRKQYMQLIMDEFADSTSNTDELVCGYHRLNDSKKENAILACVTGKVQVDDYLSVFREAEIKLNTIHIGVETILNYVKSRQEMQKSTIVINVIDGLTMLSMLFKEGSNVFISRSRLYGDVREQVIHSILENLSGLIRFTNSQNIEDITQSYYLGLDETDMRLMEAISPYGDISLKKISVNKGKVKLPENAHFVYLNTLLKKDSIDYITCRAELDKLIKLKKHKTSWLLIAAAAFVLLAAPVAYLEMRTIEADHAIVKVQEWIKAPSTVQKQKELAAVKSEMAYYKEVVTQQTQKYEQDNKLPGITSQILDSIIYQHGLDVTVTDFDYNENNGIIRVSAFCPNANISTEYVDMLYSGGIARFVDYQGYGSSSDGMFSFVVDIHLHTLETKEVQQ